MNQVRRWQRISILALLSVSVIAPVIFVSNRLKVFTSIGRWDFAEELSTTKFRAENIRLNAIEQEADEGLKEPKLVVYKDEDLGSLVSYSTNTESDTKQSQYAGDTNILENNGTDEGKEENKKMKQKTASSGSRGKDQTNQAGARRSPNVQASLLRVSDEKIKEMKDQVIRAQAYLNFAPPGSNSHLVKELKLRIKEVERAVGAATKDSDLSRRAFRRMNQMEATLDKASHVYPDCSAMATKLRAMTYNAEERVRLQKNQATYLVQLASRTTPKGLHCLSMQLTAEYFALQPEERHLPNRQDLHNPDLHHYAVFSDNVLACAVVVNSTVSFAKVVVTTRLSLHPLSVMNKMLLGFSLYDSTICAGSKED
ncbi:putative galacturonosyltransferase 6 [Citrus sinensis]|nr:putative galacturonosyltransferase 6 [Citrus sinensis]